MTGSLQIKNGKYYAVINLKENGKRRQKWICSNYSCKGNKKIAQAFLAKTLESFDKNCNSNSTQISFSEFIRIWLEIKKKTVNIVTYNGYITICDSQIIPYFTKNDILLKDITFTDIQTFFDYESECGRIDGSGGLSANSLKHLRTILHQIFKEAIRQGYIQSNPTELCNIPKAERRSPNCYTKQEALLFLESIKDDELYNVYYIFLCYGLRRSELCGIKWDSVDFNNKMLTISHTVVLNKQRIEKDITKNQSSHRSFPMNDYICNIFRSIKQEQQEYKKLFGKEYFNSDYVFTKKNGVPIRPDFITKYFQKLISKYGLKKIRLHDLRHTCASIMLSNNKGLKDVQEWLGHSNITLTSNTYGHLDMNRKKDLLSDMEKLLSAE